MWPKYIAVCFDSKAFRRREKPKINFNFLTESMEGTKCCYLGSLTLRFEHNKITVE